MENDKPSLRRQIADEFIAAMKTATSPLFFPRPAGATRPPINPASGKPFSGLNHLLLTLAEEGGDPRWLTKNQAEGLGYSPREDAQPKKLVRWQYERVENVLDQDGQPKLNEEGQPVKQTVRLQRPFLSHYQVFQARDLQNAEGQAFPAYVPSPPEKEPLDRITDILANSGVVIKPSSPGTAIYDPRDDALRFWSFRPEETGQEEFQSEALALNYAIFRNAVFDYAFKAKTPGIVLPDHPGLVLPSGWKNTRPWEGLIQEESDGLYCYVFGPAQPQDVAAVLKLLTQSRAVGWNNGGVFVRNGQPRPLPSFIPHGAIVSVIRID